MPESVRDRIMDAVAECVDRDGLDAVRLEDVAATAGVGRATIYRHFAGGRDQLLTETITREVGNFWRQVAAEVAPFRNIEDRLVHGIMAARRILVQHDLLQRLLEHEPEEIVGRLASSEQLVLLVLVDEMRRMLARESLRAGVDVEVAAEYVSRMLLSYIGTSGRWDLDDESAVRRLVRSQFLGGIVQEDAGQ
jgi:AcrR family transcriptional regulator